MLLLIIFILLYLITNYKIFYYIGLIIGLCWLGLLAFTLGTFISVYFNLF